MANVEAGNDEQLIIKALVESYDLKIGLNKTDHRICFRKSALPAAQLLV